jgi:MOSC domain-containing protein YiiM
MQGAVVQINVSPGGIPKYPIPEAHVSRMGVDGDAHAHPNIHGGPLKALLIICSETIDELAARGYPVSYGALGENLTVRGIDRRQMRPGQRYRAGEVLLELTKVRTPCRALDVYGTELQNEIFDRAGKEGDPQSPRWGMSGFYAAVIVPGTIRQNDPIALMDQVV